MPRKISRPQKQEEKRSSNWNFILYPESAPESWKEIINETHIEWVCSPIHDKDINPDGEIKKAHYHITLLYPSLKAFEQVEELTKALNAPIPIKCLSVKGSIRYMVHKDNPEKHQYEWNEIECFNGANLQNLCSATATERMEIQKEIFAFIRDNDLTEFSDLIDTIQMINNSDWFNVAVNFSTIPINSYLKSRRHKKQIQQT